MWQETKNGLYSKLTFKDFKEAFTFMQTVAEKAESMQHHPRWQNEYNVVKIWLSTHEQGDTITEKDRVLARYIGTIYNEGAHSLVMQKETASVNLSLTEAKMFTDGGSRGNPGPSAGAYAILGMDDSVVEIKGFYLGITTNNQAEFQALKAGLERALVLGIKTLNVYMDSLLVVNQLKGIYKVKNRDLWPIYQSALELSRSYNSVTFSHVPRELNKLADQEVNRVLDVQKSTV